MRMTIPNDVLEARASRRNAMIHQFYGEFPQVPAGAVADAVFQAWGDVLSAGDESTSPNLERVERTARERLREWRRRADLATARVRANRRGAAAHAQWRLSA
jgi:hypothetical protein